VRSRTTVSFRRAYSQLPQNIQRRAQEAYRLFEENRRTQDFGSRRSTKRDPYIPLDTLTYRALGIREGDQIIWFWIGTHGDYERLLG
jgi:hypothetical protein